MNLRSLRYFLKVVEYGSISRAALGLHITQPSLTQHLKHLEDHFGLELFMRHGRGVILTEAGKLLRLKAEVLIDQVDGLRSELESRKARPQGSLTVGMPISWSELVTYPVVERYRKEYPEVYIKLVINATEALADAMNANVLQLAVLIATDELSQFLSRSLVEDQLFLLGPPGSGLSKRNGIKLTEISDYPMIMPLNLTMLLRRIDRALAAAGCKLNTVMETPSTNILPLISRGLGFTILSACALPSVGFDVAFEAIPIEDTSMTWVLAAPRNRPKTAAVAVFEEFLAEQVLASVSSGRWRTARILPRLDGQAAFDEEDGSTGLRL